MNYNKYEELYGEVESRGIHKIGGKKPVKQKKQAKQKEKKYYVIEKGRITGVVKNQDVIDYSLNNFKNASYKRFETYGEAKEYVKKREKNGKGYQNFFEQSKAIVEEMGIDTFFYVDGSSQYKNSKISAGFIMMKGEEVINKQSYVFNVSKSGRSKPSREAEFKGVMMAVLEAKKQGLTRFSIVFDCLDIIDYYLVKSIDCKMAETYYNWMKNQTKGMDIEFLKVKSHKGIEGNEMVDEMVSLKNAKMA